MAVVFGDQDWFFGIHNCEFGELGASTVAPWDPGGPLVDPGAPGSATEWTLVQACIFIELGWVWELHFDSCLCTSDKNR